MKPRIPKMILVDQVRISGFRGIRNFEISLPRTTVLIGPNNCGKTSVLKAMQLALGDYSRYLSDEDFHIDDADNRSDKIVVDIRIIPTEDNGSRKNLFDENWQIEFGDKIQADTEDQQFHAFRTIAKPQSAKAGFSIERFTLLEWVEFSKWDTVSPQPKQKFSARSELMPFISIDAQRDIHHELNERTSFVGKVLSQIKYEPKDVQTLESLISDINQKAVDKSASLSSLKKNLKALNESFGSNGSVEVTPFPKKLRDLSKNFSVHFGNTNASSFSMEYHGMGTRSWASMLAVKAFTELMAESHNVEAEPYHPILAAEEPEAHLHPNAQRSLFKQILDTPGQVIVSTHSPYLAAMSDLCNLRSLSVRDGHTKCHKLVEGISFSEISYLHREILKNKGEILFAKALILFEGQTEEQIVPVMFETWFRATGFSKGINMVAVNGRTYSPYIKLAGSLGIPVAIVCDNDTKNNISTKTIVDKQLKNIVLDASLTLTSDWFEIFYLTCPNDFEAELIHKNNLSAEIVETFMNMAAEGNDNAKYLANKSTELKALDDDALLKKMRAAKTKYSAFLADVIYENKSKRSREELVPSALQDAFMKVEKWLK